MCRTLGLGRFHYKKAEILKEDDNSIYQAILEYEKAYELEKAKIHRDPLDILLSLGAAQMRLGELTNCVKNHNEDSCTFALSVNARHRNTSGSKAAIQTFTKYLKYDPGNSYVK